MLAACGHPSTAPAPPLATATSTALASPVSPPAPEVVAFPSGERTLHGYLYRPAGAGPFPVVVFNHGSEATPHADGQAQFYVAHGFVLFAPHRRGQGLSRDAGDYVGAMRGPDARVAELVAQTDDVMAAVAFVAKLPYVDGARVAVAGCSFGGIESLLAAERGTGIIAAVDFAGGAMSWSTSLALRERMKTAAANARVPIFFAQAENDFDTTPTRVLYEAATAAGKDAKMRIFPPNGTTHEEGHAFCRGGPTPSWGDDVLAFLSSAARRRRRD
ncbi:MAG TPA: dienelactone hydrolase family protein [Polyangiaceae bacterium]|nr:dienelactone hydrolase family protein [Polyangiaceae bacterium]